MWTSMLKNLDKVRLKPAWHLKRINKLNFYLKSKSVIETHFQYLLPKSIDWAVQLALIVRLYFTSPKGDTLRLQDRS